MKSLKRWLTFTGLCSLLFFSSCFDTIEEFTINADGTGSYTVTMDMYKMMEMMMSMGGEEKMKSDPEFNQVKDSTFYFNEIIKDVPDLTDEEKALFKDARFDMHMAMQEKMMQVKFSFPVTRYTDFNRIYQNSMKATNAMDKRRKSQEGKEEVNGDAQPSGNPNDAGASRGPKSAPASKPSSNPFMKAGQGNDFMRSSEMYDLDVRDGYFSKQVRMDEFKKAMEKDSSITMMKAMLKDAGISTVVHFPRPVKKVDSKYAVLSADRKTVTLKLNMDEYLEHPEYMNFKVDY